MDIYKCPKSDSQKNFWEKIMKKNIWVNNIYINIYINIYNINLYEYEPNHC